MVTDMFQVFSNVYAFLDPGDTLTFVTPFLSMKFEILLKVLVEPFLACTMVGDSLMVKRVYRCCHISLFHKVTLVDLVELIMLDFNVL